MLLPVAEWQTCLTMKRTIKHNLIWSHCGDDSIRTETLFTFWSQWQERCHYYVWKGFIRTCTSMFSSCSLLIYVTAIYIMLLKLVVFLFPRMWSSICCTPALWTAWRAHTLCRPCRSVPAPRAVLSTAWQTVQMTVERWPWCRKESTQLPPTALSYTSLWSVKALT